MQDFADISNREIFRLTWPNVISNISVPLLGMADVYIAGHVGGDSMIGAVALGSMIFNMIYWLCGFLRMGTSGLTAQSFGFSDMYKSKSVFLRSLGLALFVGFFLLGISAPLSRVLIAYMDAPSTVLPHVSQYVAIRFYAVPASLSLFAFNGWFIGMQDARSPMWVAVVSNIVNIIFSVVFVFHFQMGIGGIAAGTVVAQYFGLLMSATIFNVRYSRRLPRVAMSDVIKLRELKLFFSINTDIFLRTLCIVIAFSGFTALSSRMGETVLATNSLMLQLFTLFSYMIDGVAYAAESLSGKIFGAADHSSFKRLTHRLFFWGAVVAVVYSCVYLFAWHPILSFFKPSPKVLAEASEQIGWGILLPIVSFAAFVADGIMIGATQTASLRNSVFFALISGVAVCFFFRFFQFSFGLWAGFSVFMLMRGVLHIRSMSNLFLKENF